jgi:Tol biopolymer transport system component
VIRPLHNEAPPTIAPVKTASPRGRLWRTVGVLVSVFFVAGIGLYWARHSHSARIDAPSPAVPLTGNPGYEAFPTFSPEGSRVAYSWKQPGQQNANIYVKLIGQGDPVRLTTSTDGDFAPAWSPDGRWIAFLRARGSSHLVIIMIPSMGGQEREVAEISFGTRHLLGYWRSYELPPPFLAWSVDGQWLLSVEQSSPNEAASIIRISVNTGSKRTLTFPPVRTTGDANLAVSPSGKMLAFTRGRGLFERDIYVVSLSETMLLQGKPKQLTFDDKEIAGLAWAADGHSVVFSSKRGGRRELWRMPVNHASQPVRLTAAGDDPRDVAIAPQGRHLLYSHDVANAHIWRMPLKEQRAPARVLISSTRIDGHPKYSPDGQHIAFESNRSGYNEIWVSQADGSHAVQLTALRAWSGSPRWSPDGQKIAFDSNAAGDWDIYVIGAHGGQPARLTTSDANEYRPSWSHDGKWIYYCSTRTKPRQVWKIPVSGGAEIRVTKHGGLVAFESVDGRDIYYTKEQGLWKMPVRGGDETQVLASLLQNNFAVAKDDVYFVEDSASPDPTRRFQVLHFITHTIKTIGEAPVSPGGEISISPDEQWMLFDRTEREDGELMLVDNFR